jgi:hypothetical protein
VAKNKRFRRWKMLIEIFKTGAHTDSAGNTRLWTDEDLDAIVNKYNPALHEAPVVIGHPKDNAPAFGWVEGLQRKGSVLYAKLKDLVPEFVEAVKKGLYKKRSISLYPDMTLRHVGFLGAMPPAVKGLADVAFNESETVTIEFNEEGGHEDMGKIEELETKLREKEAALSEFAEKDKAKEEEIARLRKELDEESAKQRKTEFNSFCEGLMKEGKLTPAMKPAALDFMEILTGSGEYEFSEGDGKVKAQPVERFKAFLISLPKQVEFSEMATKGKAAEHGSRVMSHDFSGRVDEERLEIHQKAMEFVEKEGISYRDALNKALKED